MQSIDLFSVHGYTFVNLREIKEMLLNCSGDTCTQTVRRHELVPIFCCNNSIAILHTDSMGLVTSRELFRTSTTFTSHTLVVRMSRKHNGYVLCIDGHCR